MVKLEVSGPKAGICSGGNGNMQPGTPDQKVPQFFY
jgi:hypothetical protein